MSNVSHYDSPSVVGLLMQPQQRDKILTSHLKLLWMDGEKSKARSSSDAKQDTFSQVPKGSPANAVDVVVEK
jgi:hypothetical protein